MAPGFGNADFMILNHHGELALNVTFRATITWSNGTVMELSGLGSPTTIAPSGAFITFVSFLVPPNAPTGTAVFKVKAQARTVGSGIRLHPARDQSPFTVVSP